MIYKDETCILYAGQFKIRQGSMSAAGLAQDIESLRSFIPIHVMPGMQLTQKIITARWNTIIPQEVWIDYTDRVKATGSTPGPVPAGLYAVLGVAEDASTDEIKSAYRQVVKRVHPDVTGDDGEKFQVVQRAYETLSTPALRQKYNAMAQWREQTQASGLKAYINDYVGGPAVFDIGHDQCRPEYIPNMVRVFGRFYNNTRSVWWVAEKIDKVQRIGKQNTEGYHCKLDMENGTFNEPIAYTSWRQI